MARQSYEIHFSMKHRNTLKAPRNIRESPELFPDFNSVTHNIEGAKANLGYVARDAARDNSADLIFAHAGEIKDGSEVPVYEMKKRMSQSIEERAKKHRKNVGIRLSDTFIVSLPNDATPEECREMAKGMLSHLVGDSDAHALAAIHSDKERNKHLHILFTDGQETRESAIARNPKAKRVRRRDFGQLNEGGKPKELRRKMAEIINGVGEREGRRFAEHRTLKERGIERRPQIHEGQEVQDKIARGDKLTEAGGDKVERNQNIIAENITGAHDKKNLGQRLLQVPKRWRLPQFFDNWRSKLDGLMKIEERKKKAEIEKEKRASIFSKPQAIQTFLGPDKMNNDVEEIDERILKPKNKWAGGIRIL